MEENTRGIMKPRDVLETLKKLPPVCWTINLANPAEVIAIKRGVMGYYPVRVCDNAEAAEAMAKRFNDREGITGAEIEAMRCGSAFGWEVPGADPEMHKEEKN